MLSPVSSLLTFFDFRCACNNKQIRKSQQNNTKHFVQFTLSDFDWDKKLTAAGKYQE